MQFWHHITVNPKLIKHVEGIMECIQLRREEKRQREIEPISYVKDVFNDEGGWIQRKRNAQTWIA